MNTGFWKGLRRWAVPCSMALISLVGFLCVLMNPFCWFSPEGQCSGFAFNNAWKPYDGKAAGLQFFATGFLVSAVVLSWPALRAQIAHCRGEWGEALLHICFVLGYFVLLFGIWIAMYSENPVLAKKIIYAFVFSIAALGWVFIFSAVWIIHEVAFLLYKKLHPLLYHALMSLRAFAYHMLRKKRS